MPQILTKNTATNSKNCLPSPSNTPTNLIDSPTTITNTTQNKNSRKFPSAIRNQQINTHCTQLEQFGRAPRALHSRTFTSLPPTTRGIIRSARRSCPYGVTVRPGRSHQRANILLPFTITTTAAPSAPGFAGPPGHSREEHPKTHHSSPERVEPPSFYPFL